MTRILPFEKRRLLSLAAVAVAAFGLSACGGGMDDLDNYIDEVKARPGKRPEKLPEIAPYETFAYTADEDGVRSPFSPDVPTVGLAGVANNLSPDPERPKDFLEKFSLDALDMVGTIQLGGRTYGLIQDPEELVHRVLVGNYLGQNDGRITSISESEITLMEIVSDGIGGYLERDAAVSLAD